MAAAQTPHAPAVTFFRRGCRIDWGIIAGRATSHERGAIGDMSAKSRRRASWAFGQAECSWSQMIVLTWREFPEAPAVKRSLSNFRKRLARRGFPLDGWILEFQRRGAPHFHLFVAKEGELGAALALESVESVIRRGVPTDLRRGELESWIADSWLEVIGDTSEKAFDFHHGGIIEDLRSPDAAGRYVGKEAGKRNQKKLPEGYAAGVGRWWYLAPRFAPRSTGTPCLLDVSRYPFERPYGMIHQTEWLSAALPAGVAKAS